MDSCVSVVSSSSLDSEDQLSPFPAATFIQNQLPSSLAQLEVGSLNVNGGTGMLNGILTNYTVNHFIVPTGNADAFNQEVVKDILTNAIREHSDLESSLFEDPSGCAIRIRACKNLPKQKKFWAYAALIFVVVALTVFCAIYFTLPTNTNDYADTEDSSSEASANMTDTSLRIVSRAEWDAEAPLGELDPNTLPLTRVIVGHTVTPQCNSTTTTTCSVRVKNIQMDTQNTGTAFDIGYNFLIGGDGLAYEGRGWDILGAHTKGFNTGSLGVAFIGTYTDIRPEDAMVQTFSKLVELGVKLGKVHQNYSLEGQCQLQPGKKSPGLAFMAELETWPHFDTVLSTKTC